ncbi:hypothetical protein [Parapedobacter tibetensis]|nr:hypothetical protein [Parapedobacter tibetensis]
MLTLSNFEEHVSAVILQRGKRYFGDGYVFELEEMDDGAWSAGSRRV